MLIPRPHWLEILALFLFSLLLFTWGIQDQEIIAFDTRFYLFAKEMYQHGATWFPTALERPYPDYPGTSTFVIYSTALLLGGLQKFTAVLPTAITAAFTVVMTYLIGCLRQKLWGWYAAGLLLITMTFFKSARSISLDMYTTLITAICFYLLCSAKLSYRPVRSGYIYVLFILGFLFRGPIGLVVPAGVVSMYYLLDLQIKKLIITGVLAFLLLLIGTSALLLLAYHVGGHDFMQQVLRMEVLGRIDNPYLPRYFYFTNSFASYAIAYPICILVMLGIFYDMYRSGHSSDNPFIIQLFGWMIIIIIGMSIPDDKKVRYILPMAPAIALIAAYPFVALSRRNYFVLLKKLLLSLFFFLPLFLLVSSIFVVNKFPSHHWQAPFYLPYIYGFFVCMQMINVIAVFARRIHRSSLILLATAVVCFAVTMIGLIEPIELYIDRARDFVIMIETKRIQDNAQLVFYNESPDGLPLKYRINQLRDDKPIFIYGPVELMQITKAAYFVTSETYYAALPQAVSAHFSVIAKDSMGHVPIVVFKRKKSDEQ